MLRAIASRSSSTIRRRRGQPGICVLPPASENPTPLSSVSLRPGRIVPTSIPRIAAFADGRRPRNGLDLAPGAKAQDERVEDSCPLVNGKLRFFSPAETARRLGVSTRALRLYESLGLVRPLRDGAGWRAYGPEQMARLHQVLALKSLGVPLKRIGALLGHRLADLDAVLQLQEAAFRARIAGDRRRLELLARVWRRLAGGESLSVDDLLHLTGETVMGITKTQDAFALEEEAVAAVRAAGFYPVVAEAPAETNDDHWHDFDAMIFVLDGVNVVTVAATGETLTCGPGSRADFPRGAVHRESHQGYRAVFGFSVDPATISGPVNMPPAAWVG